MSERGGRLDTDSGASQGDQVARHVTTLAGMLQILTASAGQSSQYPHFRPLAQDATNLRALVDANAGADVLRAQAIQAITHAEEAIRAQTREIVMASNQRPEDTTTARRGFWSRPRRSGTASAVAPGHAPTETEVSMLVRSSDAMLSTLRKLSESIRDDSPSQQSAEAQAAQASQMPSGAHHARR